MPRLRFFAAARDAAGCRHDTLPGATVRDVLAAATDRYGPGFADVLATCRVWVDGEPAEPDDAVADDAEVAVLPPVSGGAVGRRDATPGSTRAAGPATRGSTPGSTPAPATSTATMAGGRDATGAPAPSVLVRELAADPTRLVGRLFEPVDTAGPKAALALAWVLLQVLAVLAGAVALAVVFGLVASVAGLHAAKAWRRVGERPSRAVAGLAPLVVAGAAASSAGAAGVVLLVATGASIVAGDGGVSRPRLARAGTTLRCWLGPTLAATGVVLVARVEMTAVAGLLVLVAGYDVAAYLWGAGSDGPLLGRITGIVTVAVLTFSLSVVQLVVSLPPFQTSAAVWVFGGLVATLAPLGQLAASAMLPAAAAPAPALRRLDTLVLVAPAWAFALWGYVG